MPDMLLCIVIYKIYLILLKINYLYQIQKVKK